MEKYDIFIPFTAVAVFIMKHLLYMRFLSKFFSEIEWNFFFILHIITSLFKFENKKCLARVTCKFDDVFHFSLFAF